MLHTLATMPAHPESVPVNALVPVKGTPLENNAEVNVWDLVRMIAGCAHPDAESHGEAERRKNYSASISDQTLCFMAGARCDFLQEKNCSATPNPTFDEDMAAMFDLLGLKPREAFKEEKRKWYSTNPRSPGSSGYGGVDIGDLFAEVRLYLPSPGGWRRSFLHRKNFWVTRNHWRRPAWGRSHKPGLYAPIRQRWCGCLWRTSRILRVAPMPFMGSILMSINITCGCNTAEASTTRWHFHKQRSHPGAGPGSIVAARLPGPTGDRLQSRF